MTAGAEHVLRVWVPDVWDSVDVSVTPESTITRIKGDVLRRAVGAECDPSAYQVKFRGGVIANEGATVAELALPHRAPLIVLPSARRPVR